jgi:hypothetical protein
MVTQTLGAEPHRLDADLFKRAGHLRATEFSDKSERTMRKPWSLEGPKPRKVT